jgi:hypothetical protein
VGSAVEVISQTQCCGISALKKRIGLRTKSPDQSLSPAIATAQASFLKTFQPYDRTKEMNEEARKAGATLIADGAKAPRRTFIYVNNRLEGNALSTIQAMVDLATS